MSKYDQTKNKIEQILLNPPPTKTMLQELRFNNIMIRTREGSIESLAILNQGLIERVWKVFKIQALLEKKSEELISIGLNPRAIIQNQNLLTNKLENYLNPIARNVADETIKNGLLELEIFRYEDHNTN